MKNTRPLIFDTTYILPLFGIKINELKDFNNVSKTLWSKGLKGHKIYLPTTCLLEVLYKLNGEYRKSNDIIVLNRYSIALPSILSSKVVELFNPLLNPEANRLAIGIKHAGHSDLLDCLIAATAVALKGIFVSEDLELRDIMKKNPETKDTPIWTWQDIIKLIPSE